MKYEVGQVVTLANGREYPIVKVDEDLKCVYISMENEVTEPIPFDIMEFCEVKNYFLKRDKEKIDHPAHYNREGSMECIDEMMLIFGKEAVRHFCMLNAWKYRYRASDKNGEEDLKKSDWYIRKLKEIDQPF